MNHHHRTASPPLSPEDILIALDQLDQTVEVMAAVIKRLKRDLAHVLPRTEKPSSPTPDLAELKDIPIPDTGWH